jgi:hypothetical protein
LGYAPATIDLWATRAKQWAAGAIPRDLRTVASNKSDHIGRDVYLYVISGHKVLNPAAARGLIERVSS